HLRGRALLPSEEFRVPALFFAPGRIAPAHFDGIASQIDLAPTILGYLGRSFRTPFFGRDLRASDPDRALAIMVYNRERYGVRPSRRLTVLPENQSPRYYDVQGAAEPVQAEPRDGHREDARDALALLQVAEDLLRTGHFTTDPCPSVPGLGVAAHPGC